MPSSRGIFPTKGSNLCLLLPASSPVIHPKVSGVEMIVIATLLRELISKSGGTELKATHLTGVSDARFHTPSRRLGTEETLERKRVKGTEACLITLFNMTEYDSCPLFPGDTTDTPSPAQLFIFSTALSLTHFIMYLLIIIYCLSPATRM